MKTLKFPIIFITIFIILGIILGRYILLDTKLLIVTNLVLLVILLASHLLANKKLQLNYPFVIILIFSSVFLGLLLQKRIDKRNFSNHYSHFLQKDTTNIVVLEVVKNLKSTKYYQ